MGFLDCLSGGPLRGLHGMPAHIEGGLCQIALHDLLQRGGNLGQRVQHLGHPDVEGFGLVLGVCCRTVLNPTLSSFRPPVLPCE